MTEKFNPFFEGKQNVLILGYGREGRSMFRFLQKYYPKLPVGIADKNGNLDQEKDLPARLHVGNDYLKALLEYDLIIKSPGVSVGSQEKEITEKMTSQTEMFLAVYGNQTIGITGTKGKSTTSTLVYHLLKSSGKEVLLLGNVGSPAFDSIEKIHEHTLIVYELSAHQLEHVRHSPHIAALLNIFPEHLDYFQDSSAYQAAKLNIFRYQNKNDIAVSGIPVDTGKACYTMRTNEEEIVDMLGAGITGSQLLEMAHLKGQHNLGNLLLALRVMQAAGIPAKESFRHLYTFQPLPHRLEYIGTFGGIEFYNDSISTVPQSAMAAVDTLEGLDALILGGFDRGLNYSEMVDYLNNSTIGYFFFIGQAGKRMHELFQKSGREKNLFVVTQLEEVFEILAKTPGIKKCLLSPAAASYDQFTNFEHRGEYFRTLAQGFKKSGV